jgi:regulator of RNase E activity RraA
VSRTISGIASAAVPLHSSTSPHGRLLQLDTCAVSDAVDQLGLPSAISGLVNRTGRKRIAGRVITVKLAAAETGRKSQTHLCTAAIEAGGAGDVIVVEQRTGIDAAGWGGMLSNAAKMRGVEGVIIEGPARDIDEAADLGFAVYSRATTPRTARGRVQEISTGQPIQVGDVTVATGDYVIADATGVVFFSAADAVRVLEAAERIAAREAAMTRDILAGRPVSAVMGASYETMLEPKA